MKIVEQMLQIFAMFYGEGEQNRFDYIMDEYRDYKRAFTHQRRSQPQVFHTCNQITEYSLSSGSREKLYEDLI